METNTQHQTSNIQHQTFSIEIHAFILLYMIVGMISGEVVTIGKKLCRTIVQTPKKFHGRHIWTEQTFIHVALDIGHWTL